MPLRIVKRMLFQRQQRFLLLLLLTALGSPFDAWGRSSNESFHLGRPPTVEEVRAWDIDVAPDGEGLPAGRGTVAEGAAVYTERCATCHGATGVEGPMPKLVGGHGTLTTNHPVKTVGSYWAYATTLYDYIYRAMPFVAPQSLLPDEVYAVVAWILFRNGLIEERAVLTRETLPAVRMPYRDGLVSDPRPDVSRSPTRQSPARGDVDCPISGSRTAHRHFLR